MGPFRRYVRRKLSTAGLLRPFIVFSSIRETISGLSMPWAACGKGDGGNFLRRSVNPASMLIAACAKPVCCGSDDFLPTIPSCEEEPVCCGPKLAGLEGAFMPAKFLRRSWLLMYALVFAAQKRTVNDTRLFLLKTVIFRFLSLYPILFQMRLFDVFVTDYLQMV